MSIRRLFVALSIPARITDALLDIQEGIPGARWQDAENLHITLRFIGEVDRHQHADILSALEGVPFSPFPIRVADVGHFEGKRRAKAIWARVEPSDALGELQHSVEMACRRAGLPAETRKFIPHITLARLNAGSGPIADWLSQHGDLAPGPWEADGFSLYESDLTPQGAIYSEIAQFR
ncbi:RNA 2',3'-cyclic phosphodiesterase [Aurantiacibacter sp. D1-12]|uniref:RNA 2',3'-cyclic phosphodiesterase n=1 Tax=Aurantiacibacter sp. D1-12 TaxID=2993658 RepID=UPI00237CB91F|nr:RNA 2',3'-cyclic phosphodiesterase [Aurantiacibacter sp. D1-12]MDE1468029.1 RNA 2',3'-cyclic phosphodiesterase [Aurantiacibacter sp. D1-12]